MTQRDADDPTAGFSDLQWYMYRQRNVAFFGAYTRRALADADVLDLARDLVARAPQLRTGFVGAAPEQPLPDTVLQRLVYRESVATLDGFPDRWFDAGGEIFQHPDLPLFRLRYADAGTTAASGPQGFLLVQVAHALVEGADSALLSRSQSAAHRPAFANLKAPSLTLAAARLAGALLPPFHLLAAHLAAPRPGPYVYASRTASRPALSAMARELGVSQRALFYALAMDALFGSQKSRSVSTAYSAVDTQAVGRDAFMRMRMLFARFSVAPDFPNFARSVEARLRQSERREAGFTAEMNARGMRAHRALDRLIPFAYGPRLFQFTPFDMILAVVPPHRLGGALTGDLLEPVYAGAALEGVNACVIVPGRLYVTFNFYIQRKLLDLVGWPKGQLAARSSRSFSAD